MKIRKSSIGLVIAIGLSAVLLGNHRMFGNSRSDGHGKDGAFRWVRRSWRYYRAKTDRRSERAVREESKGGAVGIDRVL